LDDVVDFREMPMPDKYADERYDPSLAHCSQLSLEFDGKELKLLGGKTAYSYPAVSGRPNKDGKFDYSPDNQKKINAGPIPEGKYWINPDEIWENAWYKIGASEEAWGKYRVTIHPFTTTITHKRGGFFIHGGSRPGSAGCIDLTSHISRFVSDLG
jgi:hypothetical protein